MRRPQQPTELSLRGVCLGGLVTVVFMSANAYLGLKTGITFASSIPAAVLSMGLFKLFGGSGPLENNIVQTQASAAGTLCNVNLALPGLILIHYWSGFPVIETVLVCLLGGFLGIAFSVPLRRVMVVDSDLPFPEGVAAAEVLASADKGDDSGIRELGFSAAVSACFSLLTTATALLPERLSGAIVAGHAVFRLDCNLSLALIGIGYLVRLGCCLALLIGLTLAWGIAVPLLTSLDGGADPAAKATMLWAEKVRLIGAGLIAVAGLWTVARLFGPVCRAVAAGFRSRKRAEDGADIPSGWVAAALALLSACVAVALYRFLSVSAGQGSASVGVSLALTALTVGLAFAMATACGYLAGLLGSSSSPISGIGILTALIVAACIMAALPSTDSRFAGAVTLFVTSLVVTASSIANDNLQDLKSGAILGATPWKQQVALAIGVAIGAAALGVLLPLLYKAYGFAGALPRSGMDESRALAAPQAALLAQVTEGIVRHRLDWLMVGIGGALGVFFVALEHILDRKGLVLPALSIGIGMYLPAAVIVTIAFGGVLGWLAERAAPAMAAESLRRRGVLLSSGFLVGESAVGILTAFADIVTGKNGALTLNGNHSPLRYFVVIASFGLILSAFYRLVARQPRANSRQA